MHLFDINKTFSVCLKGHYPPLTHAISIFSLLQDMIGNIVRDGSPSYITLVLFFGTHSIQPQLIHIILRNPELKSFKIASDARSMLRASVH